MGFEPLPLAFRQFEKDRERDLTRIAGRTRGSHSADDLKSEAWLMAVEIGRKQGRRLDLFVHLDQELVLAWLYKRYVDYVDGKWQESIDQSAEDEGLAWSEHLPAPAESDPLAQLERADDDQPGLLPTYKGFSEYSAYMILLMRCEMSPVRLAEYLCISFATLRRRIEQSAQHAERQLSLFELGDIDFRFIPRSVAIRGVVSSWQLAAQGGASRLMGRSW